MYSQVLQDVCQRLDNTFQAFFRRLKNGEKAGFPRFRGQNRYDSFTYPQSGYKLEGKCLKLSKIGNVGIKLHRQIEGKIKTCTIKRKNGKFYACFACEIEAEPQLTGKQVGVDLGEKHLAITSDGEFFEHPKYLRKSEQKLKRLQRTVSRRKKGSNRRRKAVAMLAKLYESIANQRKDTAHKISRYLVDHYDLIALKSIADAGWRMLIQFTTYKAEYAGKKVV